MGDIGWGGRGMGVVPRTRALQRCIGELQSSCEESGGRDLQGRGGMTRKNRIVLWGTRSGYYDFSALIGRLFSIE